jgi:type II secretory pathway pseudopilin PulG
MKSGSQVSGIRSQGTGVRGQTFDLQTFRPSTACRRAGFTLVEVLLASLISVLVFAAMGALLSRSFALWMDGAARWQLAQHVRITRERILRGGFEPSGAETNQLEGLLAAGTNVNIVANSVGLNVGYGTLTTTISGLPLTNYYGICAQSNQLYLYNQNNSTPYWSGGFKSWCWAAKSGAAVPPVTVSGMTATHTNPVLTIKYQVNYSAMGRTFTQPCTIRAHLINE